MIQTWIIEPHIKGDTFKAAKITFPFPITDCVIKMQFKKGYGNNTSFDWTSEGETPTFEKISATEVIMKSRILDVPVFNYISDLQITFADGTIETQFKASLQIIQDVTR